MGRYGKAIWKEGEKNEEGKEQEEDGGKWMGWGCGGVGGVMGKGTNLQTLSRAATTFPPHVASHLRVSKIPTELSADRTADGGNAGERRKGERRRGGGGGGMGGGGRGGGKNVQIFSLK